MRKSLYIILLSFLLLLSACSTENNTNKISEDNVNKINKVSEGKNDNLEKNEPKNEMTDSSNIEEVNEDEKEALKLMESLLDE